MSRNVQDRARAGWPLDEAPARLIAEDEPEAVAVEAGDAASPFVLVADHAGRRVPRSLGSLGLDQPEYERHIAWDIGIAGVCDRMAPQLAAPTIRQRYSRLVIDCNRPPHVASSVPEISEITTVPGNVGIGADARGLRVREIFEPYHASVTAALDARAARGQETLLIAMHSFTPVFKGVARPWQVGLLYNRDSRLASVLLELLRAPGDLQVGDNEPYAVSDLTDYTLPVHGEQRGLPHVGIEIRQDLVADAAGEAYWAQRLSELLLRARDRLR